MNHFIEEIHELLPKISKYRIYKIIYSIKGRYAKYGSFGLGKRDGPKFGISERQMPKLINLLINYGYLSENGETRHSKGGFKCRLFNISKQFKEILSKIKDFVKQKFEYITPIEFVKTRFDYVIKQGKLKFEVNGNKYIIHLRGRFKGVIYSVVDNKIISPTRLI